ncbi:kinase-like domain-containing protein [Polychytrium aggregatum]|uniref:kinase-like domain-containing protein n=1 Tax=Polychytrium aggregatum TaxID=110093 RepID=UPI0022FE8A95|nr:kinase-like domain-containing protein [Polychytrium aggregatum]KAI9206201.1 kinase-like domain-containing protein [Polychytrium aggregatum]
MPDTHDFSDIIGSAAASSIDRYIKDKKVGEGTFAVVYLGFEKSSKRKVAIKKIKVATGSHNGMDLSAIRELRCLQELKHPNVIELIDVFSHKTNINLVLEYLDADLETLIKNKSVVFSAADVKSWMLMTIRGVAHCHKSNILHRDLKPNNLLLASDGVLKLADFGLAREYADPDRAMSPQVVTRWYRSPELLLGAPYYCGAVDMWSVGCIFAELMIRNPYVAAETDIGQLTKIFEARGTPTETDWPGVKELPGWALAEPKAPIPKPPLLSLFSAAGEDVLDLLESMLIYDPLKRITANDALAHRYFTNLPRPTAPERLPRMRDSSHAADESKPTHKRKADDSFAISEDGIRKIAKRLFV